MISTEVTLANWIQAVVALLALAGVIVAVIAVVTSNGRAQFQYEAQRFDLVVDCVTEATLLASSMKSAVMPLWRRPEDAFKQALEVENARRDSFNAGTGIRHTKELSEEQFAYLDSLYAENNATIDSLHNLIEQLAALSSKAYVLCGALPKRMRTEFRSEIERETMWLEQSVMLMYLVLVPSDGPTYSGLKGIENFRNEFLSRYTSHSHPAQLSESTNRLTDITEDYLAEQAKSMRSKHIKAGSALSCTEADAKARADFSGPPMADLILKQSVKKIHDLLGSTAVSFSASQKRNR